MSSQSVDKNSNGVLANQNRPLTTISHPSSPGAFCKPAWSIRRGDLFRLVTDAVCPECGSALLSISRVTRSLPFDDVVEVHVTSKELRCTDDGCGHRVDCGSN